VCSSDLLLPEATQIKKLLSVSNNTGRASTLRGIRFWFEIEPFNYFSCDARHNY
jgi:hypothetical protein